MAGERLDLSSEGFRCEKSPALTGRRFVGVQFACCDVYTRVYINRDATAYEGHCPRCFKRVQLLVGPDGTDARFFTAS